MLVSPKPWRAEQLRALLHADAVVGDGQRPVRRLVRHGDAHGARLRVAHGVADRFLGDAQQLVLVLGAAGRWPMPPPSKVQVTPPGTVERSASWRSAISSPARRV